MPHGAARGRAGVLLGAMLLSGCTGGGTVSSTAVASSPPPSPVTLLLRLDDLPLPGFTVQSGPSSLDVTRLAGGDPGLAEELRRDGVTGGATVRFFRAVPQLADANGPVDIIEVVESTASAAAAHRVFAAEAGRRDAEAGAVSLSTGPLGDEGHGDFTTASASGVVVAQTVLAWRVGDLVTVLTVRERLAGSPLAHALAVALPALVHQRGTTPQPAAA